MTNKQVIYEWCKYLEDVIGCHADEHGNRPCDYGAPCDTCMACDAYDAYDEAIRRIIEG